MKIAIIGAGRIAHFHLQAMRGVGTEVVGVCTRSDSGAAFSEQYKIPHFKSLTEMVSQTKPDGILLLTQPSSYLDCLKELRPFNIPLLMEKPVSYSSQEAEALIPYLPKLTMVGQNRRFYSNLEPIRLLIARGEKLMVHAFLCERAQDIRIRSKKDCDHWHVMNAIHIIDLLKHLFGEPEKYLFRNSLGTLDFSTLSTFQETIYTTQSGHQVHYHSNLDSPGGWRMFVFHKGQEIVVQPIEKTTIKKIGSTEEVVLAKEDTEFKQGFFKQAQCFVSGVMTGSPSQEWITFEDALKSVRMAEELYRRESV